MCGICLILGIPITHHHFHFDFLQAYQTEPQQDTLPLHEHIQQQKLVLPPLHQILNVPGLLSKRGPNNVSVCRIDLFKTNYQQAIFQQQIMEIDSSKAIGIQSTLHLSGDKYYLPSSPGSYFLYNGQIWSTGNLPPIDHQQGQNDGEWLHRTLMNCNGSQEKMLQVLSQIRGDYSIILIEDDQIFIMKDYFGKRSLLLGMSQEHLYFTSVPLFEMTQEQGGPQQLDQEHEDNVKAKYQAEWMTSKNKMFFQVPANSLITIRLRNHQAYWSHRTIHNIDLKSMCLQKKPDFIQNIISTAKKLLIESVKQLTKSLRHTIFKGQVRVGVMFSGGIDSTLIARLLDLCLPKGQIIDLVNLAFKEDAPDRQAAKISYQELCGLNPSRHFNLIFLNRTLEDIQTIKKDLLQSIYPKSTHMDFNIAAALHLASSATKAPIVMSGLGADQIFAGYSRYRIAFKRGGYPQMQNQMLFDMQRLWIRNLGRDDRAISDNGKQARYPFLYLPLWEYLRTVPLEILTQGNGQKKLLRKIAKELGLQKASQFKKRAIQFGTRLAKLSNIKSFGSNRKAKGTYQYH